MVCGSSHRASQAARPSSPACFNCKSIMLYIDIKTMTIRKDGYLKEFCSSHQSIGSFNGDLLSEDGRHSGQVESEIGCSALADLVVAQVGDDGELFGSKGRRKLDGDRHLGPNGPAAQLSILWVVNGSMDQEREENVVEFFRGRIRNCLNKDVKVSHFHLISNDGSKR